MPTLNEWNRYLRWAGRILLGYAAYLLFMAWADLAPPGMPACGVPPHFDIGLLFLIASSTHPMRLISLVLAAAAAGFVAERILSISAQLTPAFVELLRNTAAPVRVRLHHAKATFTSLGGTCIDFYGLSRHLGFDPFASFVLIIFLGLHAIYATGRVLVAGPTLKTAGSTQPTQSQGSSQIPRSGTK